MNGRRRQLHPELLPGLPAAAALSLRRLRALLPQVVLPALLVVMLAAISLPVTPAGALSLPWRQSAAGDQPAGSLLHRSPLQEVSPPEAVQQLQAALGARQPVVEILAPQPDSVLPAGPWTLRLRVHDWPLVDGGALGLGPHLVVQLDQEPARIWTRTEGELPELSPGSHRLTVYAAQPWGEALKTPGAARQIRLHRTIANPPALPAPGSPQLLAVSPSGASAGEPLLLDWLLLDAPLQNVGGSGTQWRLRVSINGDDLLLDQQSPLWLRGWRPGANSLRLELLDARGEALNPPFNSLVQEVDLGRAGPLERWRGGPLSATELAILIGTAPAQPLTVRLPGSGIAPPPADIQNGSGSGGPARGAGAGSLANPPPATVDQPTPEKPENPSLPSGSDGGGRLWQHTASRTAIQPPEGSAKPQAGEPEITPAGQAADGGGLAPDGEDRSDAQSGGTEDATEAPVVSAGDSAPADSAAGAWRDDSLMTVQPSASGSGEAAATSATPEGAANAAAQPSTAISPSAAQAGSEAAEPPLDPSPPSMTAASAIPAASDAAPGEEPRPAPIAAAEPLANSADPERVHPTTSLTGRARDLVNPDGTLRRPERRGPLAGLRERLQR